METDAERQMRIKRQNQEIIQRHKEVEADKKRAQNRKAMVNSKVGTQLADMTPAERNATMEKKCMSSRLVPNDITVTVECKKPEKSSSHHRRKQDNKGKQSKPGNMSSSRVVPKETLAPQTRMPPAPAPKPVASCWRTRSFSDSDDEQNVTFKNIIPFNPNSMVADAPKKSSDFDISENIQNLIIAPEVSSSPAGVMFGVPPSPATAGSVLSSSPAAASFIVPGPSRPPSAYEQLHHVNPSSERPEYRDIRPKPQPLQTARNALRDSNDSVLGGAAPLRRPHSAYSMSDQTIVAEIPNRTVMPIYYPTRPDSLQSASPNAADSFVPQRRPHSVYSEYDPTIAPQISSRNIMPAYYSLQSNSPSVNQAVQNSHGQLPLHSIPPSASPNVANADIFVAQRRPGSAYATSDVFVAETPNRHLVQNYYSIPSNTPPVNRAVQSLHGQAPIQSIQPLNPNVATAEAFVPRQRPNSAYSIPETTIIAEIPNRNAISNYYSTQSDSLPVNQTVHQVYGQPPMHSIPSSASVNVAAPDIFAPRRRPNSVYSMPEPTTVADIPSRNVRNSYYPRPQSSPTAENLHGQLPLQAVPQSASPTAEPFEFLPEMDLSQPPPPLGQYPPEHVFPDVPPYVPMSEMHLSGNNANLQLLNDALCHPPGLKIRPIHPSSASVLLTPPHGQTAHYMQTIPYVNEVHQSPELGDAGYPARTPNVGNLEQRASSNGNFYNAQANFSHSSKNETEEIMLTVGGIRMPASQAEGIVSKATSIVNGPNKASQFSDGENFNQIEVSPMESSLAAHLNVERSNFSNEDYNSTRIKRPVLGRGDLDQLPNRLASNHPNLYVHPQSAQFQNFSEHNYSPDHMYVSADSKVHINNLILNQNLEIKDDTRGIAHSHVTEPLFPIDSDYATGCLVEANQPDIFQKQVAGAESQGAWSRLSSVNTTSYLDSGFENQKKQSKLPAPISNVEYLIDSSEPQTNLEWEKAKLEEPRANLKSYSSNKGLGAVDKHVGLSSSCPENPDKSDSKLKQKVKNVGKKSSLASRMEAVRNDNSKKFSRSHLMNQLPRTHAELTLNGLRIDSGRPISRDVPPAIANGDESAQSVDVQKAQVKLSWSDAKEFGQF